MIQLDLFGESFRAQKFTRVYQGVDHMQEKFGKHTVFLGTSLLAQQFAQNDPWAERANGKDAHEFKPVADLTLREAAE